MPTPTAARTSASTSATQAEPGHRVAIVCRLGQAAREAASGFVAHLGLEPLLLPDPADTGDGTFIERLGGRSDLDFAIVLLSADTLGTAPAVLLEIGFLLGALGRDRVCFVLEGKQELVPELQGVVRHPMDDGGLWRLLLAREMKQAGLSVDMNRAL
jgi:predicted nucleotide-binding protein